MEASGVFATFKMQTNYRSNQEILDLANTTLSTIEANQFAKLRLRANSLDPVTSSSLLEKVHINYHYVSKLAEFNNVVLPNLMANDIVPYINQCLARDEKVAILAYKNSDIRQMEELLSNFYQPENVLNIAPAKVFDSTVFSSYIRYFGDSIASLQLAANPQTNSITPVAHQIRDHMLQDAVLMKIVKNASKARLSIENQIDQWVAENWEALFHFQRMYSAQSMTKQELLDTIMQNMLDYEIKNNRIRSSLLAKKNNDRKADSAVETAKILLSTIHSAKGLEFDNVIILYQSDAGDMSEERKRMYYVALTRAMRTEKIVAFGTGRTCLLEENYYEMVNNHLESEGLPPIER